MPTERRTFLIFAAIAFAMVVGSGWFFILPKHREAAAFNEMIERLEVRMAGHDVTLQSNDNLQLCLRSVEDRIARELREIPESPGVSKLIHSLSLPIDDATVIDQTFTTGREIDAADSEEITWKSIPVEVDFVATFDRVFELLAAAESSDRLVRIAELELIHTIDEKKPATSGLVHAVLSLDAIYESGESP